MEFDRQLADLLSEFARTLVTDFPIQAILDHLVVRIVDVLPITAAGVTVISPGPTPSTSPPPTTPRCGSSSCNRSWAKARASPRTRPGSAVAGARSATSTTASRSSLRGR